MNTRVYRWFIDGELMVNSMINRWFAQSYIMQVINDGGHLWSM